MCFSTMIGGIFFMLLGASTLASLGCFVAIQSTLTKAGFEKRVSYLVALIPLALHVAMILVLFLRRK